jgi:hypothetical protein
MAKNPTAFSLAFSLWLLAGGITISLIMLLSPLPISTPAISQTPTAEDTPEPESPQTEDDYPSQKVLADIFPYLVSESIRFAGEQGITETHYNETDFTYYSYDPTLNGTPAAKWSYSTPKKPKEGEEPVPVLEVSGIPLKTGLPISLMEISTSSILNNLNESDTYALINGVLEITLTDKGQILQVYFSSGRLERIIQLGDERDLLNTISYNYEAHPDLKNILLSLSEEKVA